MIVPKNRLLLWAAGVFLPVMTLAPLYPVSAAGVMTSLLLLIGLDALRAVKCPGGIMVTVAQTVRAAKGRLAEMPCRLEMDRNTPRVLRLGVAFPAGLRSDYSEMRIELPRSEAAVVVSWPFVGERYGRYDLKYGYLEADSPMGFWGARRRVVLDAHVRVYPTVIQDYRALAGLLSGRSLGVHAQRQVGKGREFEQLREYLPGDSYEDIHWKATAKLGHPITKVYQIERTQEVYVAVDLSRLSTRTVSSHPRSLRDPENGSAKTTLAERYVTAALVLGLTAERQGDLFGLLTFSESVGCFLRARNGKAHYRACLDALSTLKPEPVSPDFNDVFSFIAKRIPKRALILFLTHLDDPVLSESFARNVGVIARKHLVLVNMIRPNGAAPLFSSPDITHLNDIYHALDGHTTWDRLRELQKVLGRHGVTFGLVSSEALCARLVSHYLTVKQRQQL